MKKNSVKKFLTGALAVTMVFGVSFTASSALGSENTTTDVASLLDELTAGKAISTNQYDPNEIVTVVVELEGETTLDVDEYVTMFRNDSIGYSADASVAAYRADMVSQQEEIETQISAFAPDTVYKYHYTNLLNGFAAQVEYQYIEQIKALDGVKSVYLTQSYDYDADWEEDEENSEYISLEEYYELTGCDAIDLSKSATSDAGSASQMGLEAAWEAGYTGAGKVVGVFDSSIRYTHQLFSYMDPEVKKDGEAGLLSNYKTRENLLESITENQSTLNLFVSGWGSWFHGYDETGFSADVQKNILNGDFYYNSKVPFSVDYACGDLDAWDGDSGSHGTHVSGIVAGNGGDGYYELSGVKGSAYDAQIMFFKVFDENDDFGQESDEAVFAALDDAVTLGVNAFNLSLGIPNGFTTMNTYAQAGYQSAYNRASASGISICVSAGNDTRDNHPGALVNGYTTLLPNSASLGFSGSLYAPMTIASAQGTGYSYINNGTPVTRNYNDTGPSTFTSWGVTESMNLKPDVMSPGGNIWSAGAASDTALSSKSGTSMASPNAEGLFILAQQYVDENLDTFGVKTGTQEYSNLINQLVASTATAYQPFVSSGDLTRQNLYFSPRRQGAGMVNIDNVINSLVVLHNEVSYNGITGESARTKVELGDKLGTNFDIKFTMDNYDSKAKTFDVLACLQTDNTTESNGRTNLANTNTYGSDIDAIEDGVMKVTSISGGTVVGESSNINRYGDDASATKISVPANSSVEITVNVTLNEETMKAYDEKYPNGMFLEGFVFFDNVDSDYETLSIPYMGFRGDWNAAPIFDLATAYDDISGLTTSDAEYPLFYTTTLNSLVNGYDVVLGANQFTGTSLPDYFGGASTSYYNTIRSYLNNLRVNNELNGAYVTISPNGDGMDDIAYTALYLLRNAKALCVAIKDEAGNIVNVIGPEYEYFEAKVNDGNRTQQAALSYGTKYDRQMYWDGTDFDGNMVKEGTYTFEVRAMLEYEYLNSVDYGDKDSCLEALMNSDNVQTQSFDVNVDVTAPKVDMSLTRDNVLTINASDASGIQALAVYYKNARVSDIIRVNNTETSMTIDLKDLIENLPSKSVADDLEVQVVDYGMNMASAVNPVVVDKTALQIAVDTADTLKGQGALDNVVPAVVIEFEGALDNAKTVLADTSADQTVVDSAFYRLANAIHMLDFIKGDKNALEALIEEAEKYEEGNYTTDSWAALQDAIDAAKEVAADDNAMQKEVDEALNNLKDAIANLVIKADKTRLQAFYEMVEGLDKSLYTEASVAGLTDPMANAKAVLENSDATQAEVDSAYEVLVKAYVDLRLVPNKDLLQELINKANSLSAANYTAKTWSVMTEALEEAKAALTNENIDQADVDTLYENLMASINGLEVVKSGDTTVAVNTGDTGTKGSVKTGDTTNMIGALGLLASLSVIACLKKKKYN